MSTQKSTTKKKITAKQKANVKVQTKSSRNRMDELLESINKTLYSNSLILLLLTVVRCCI